MELPDSAIASTATTHAARDHARAQAGTRVRGMPTIPATTALDLTPEIARGALWDETVEPGEYAAHHLPRSALLRLIDLEGDACAHMTVHNARQPAERLNLADTVKVQWQAYPTVGSRLLSDLGRALLTIVADTSGRHDALCSAPNRHDHETKYGQGAVEGRYPNARDRLIVAALKAGLERRDVGPSMTFFKGARVTSDGALELPSETGARGAEVILRCELPVHVAIANVPHALDERPGYECTALRITAWRPDSTPRPLAPPTPEMGRAASNNDDWLGSHA